MSDGVDRMPAMAISSPRGLALLQLDFLDLDISFCLALWLPAAKALLRDVYRNLATNGGVWGAGWTRKGKAYASGQTFTSDRCSI